MSCHIWYSVVSYLADQSPRLGERELKCLLSITRNCVVSVRRGFLFLLVLRIGCIIFYTIVVLE